VAALLGLGITVRLFNLTNPPFDFHPTRQLHSAMIARGMYYARASDAPEWRREMAVRQWQGREVVEPRILETIVAWGYLLAGGRVVDRPAPVIGFWVLGGSSSSWPAASPLSGEGPPV
jgi:hypothetical protein